MARRRAISESSFSSSDAGTMHWARTARPSAVRIRHRIEPSGFLGLCAAER